jgi:putative hydrolase of the HAD superfamily
MDTGLHQNMLNILKSASVDLAPIPTGEAAILSHLDGIKVILFDLYGTLFLSSAGDLGLHEDQTADRVFANALEAADLRPQRGTSIDWLEAWKGLIRDEHQRRREEGEDFPEVEIREIWQRFGQAFCDAPPAKTDDPAWSIAALIYETGVNQVCPAPGVLSLLSTLRQRNLLLGIVSNAQFYTPLLFEAYLDAPYPALGFRHDLCVFSYQLRSAKPSPAMFSGVLKRLEEHDGIQPHEVAYVGNDMLNDIWTASQAGCRTILFAGDQRSLRKRQDKPECANLEPDAVMTELMQMMECL